MAANETVGPTLPKDEQSLILTILPTSCASLSNLSDNATSMAVTCHTNVSEVLDWLDRTVPGGTQLLASCISIGAGTSILDAASKATGASAVLCIALGITNLALGSLNLGACYVLVTREKGDNSHSDERSNSSVTLTSDEHNEEKVDAPSNVPGSWVTDENKVEDE